MASKASESASHKRGNGDVRVLGRSAATGRFVLKPASKPGSISIREANTAVKSVKSKKK